MRFETIRQGYTLMAIGDDIYSECACTPDKAINVCSFMYETVRYHNDD